MSARLAAVLVLSAYALPSAATELAACRGELAAALKRGVYQTLEWTAPHRQARVVVGPEFFKLELQGQARFAETVNCVLLAGKKDLCLNFNLVHWETGEQAGRFRNCRYRGGPGR